MKSLLKKLTNPINLIILSLVIILVGSAGAQAFHSSFNQVKVSEIAFETGVYNGQLSGLLYMPKNCNEANPCPTIILTHGYLNSKEMQDAPAIEMSRRGYIVLAIDMYDHGDSTWDTPAAFSFFATPIYDAVQYMYEQPYVLKGADGDGMIAVSGHSMGGFSSEAAVAKDEADFVKNGYRKIAVSLAVGADFRYTGPVFASFSDRTNGTIAGQFDEFFFDNSGNNSGTVLKKDYTKDVIGRQFLGFSEDDKTSIALPDTFYYVESANSSYLGERVIYTPYETHPWNHFSSKTTAYMIEFYDHAFNTQMQRHLLPLNTIRLSELSSTNQIWLWKEIFEGIALIGLITLIFPIISLLLKINFFKASTTLATLEVTKIPSKETKNLLIGASVFTTLLSAWYIPIFMDRSSEGLLSMTTAIEGILHIVILLSIVAWGVCLFLKMSNKSVIALNKNCGLLILCVVLCFRFLLKNPTIFFNTNAFFNAPAVNTIIYWALCATCLTALITIIVHYAINKEHGVTPMHLGIQGSANQIFKAFLLALSAVGIIYAVVFIVDIIFKTDFRLWVFAIKSFGMPQLIASLKYLPWFFIFYFVSAIATIANTRTIKGIKGDLLAIWYNTGSIILLLAYQYGKLFLTGLGAFDNFSLNGILCFALVPTLAIAAIINRRTYEKTGNIWLGTFFTTLFLTIMTLANTAIYLLVV